MKRVAVGQRADWVETAEKNDFTFHEMYGEPYWDEHNAYQFTLKEVEDNIEDPTAELIDRCHEAVTHVCKHPELMNKLKIPAQYHQAIIDSWALGSDKFNRDIYGRFDFSYDGVNPVKMLEFNADTPTGLYESAVFQWMWLEENIKLGKLPKDADQFNSIHEKLVDAFTKLKVDATRFHFAGVLDNVEDELTVRYMSDVAFQAGLEVTVIDISQIGIDKDNYFTDLEDNRIEHLFKLYPLEHMFKEDFGPHLITTPTKIYEPLWKSILSNKGILPILWDMFPDHPNILPAYFEGDRPTPILGEYVRKPLLSREGENITIVSQTVHNGLVSKGGEYGEEGFVIQSVATLPKFGDDYALIGSWVVDGMPAGMCIREDKGPITANLSRFVPHYIEG